VCGVQCIETQAGEMDELETRVYMYIGKVGR
jgi:hypothetical protein